MKRTLLPLILASAVSIGFFGGCSPYRSHFANGYRSLEASYLDKPNYDSIPRRAWYASARATTASGFNLSFLDDTKGDRNRVYEALLYHGSSYRNVSWAGGVMGYYGNYRLGNQHGSVLVDHYLSRKPYYGFGGKFTIAWNIPLQHVNIRPLGIEAVVHGEMGQYPAFIRLLSGQSPLVTTDEKPFNHRWGVVSEIRGQLRDGGILGYQINFVFADWHNQPSSFTSEREELKVLDGMNMTVIGGVRRMLFQVHMGVGQQWFLATSMTYRLSAN